MNEKALDPAASLGPSDTFARRLIQVVYRSRCLTDEAGERDILEASRRNNPARGITGVLVSHGGWFMQVLEGPAEEITGLLARIESDPRNGEYLLLRANTVEERDFGDWAMASTVVDADRFLEMLDGLMSGKAAAMRMLSSFVMTGRWRESPTA